MVRVIGKDEVATDRSVGSCAWCGAIRLAFRGSVPFSLPLSLCPRFAIPSYHKLIITHISSKMEQAPIAISNTPRLVHTAKRKRDIASPHLPSNKRKRDADIQDDDETETKAMEDANDEEWHGFPAFQPATFEPSSSFAFELSSTFQPAFAPSVASNNFSDDYGEEETEEDEEETEEGEEETEEDEEGEFSWLYSDESDSEDSDCQVPKDWLARWRVRAQIAYNRELAEMDDEAAAIHEQEAQDVALELDMQEQAEEWDNEGYEAEGWDYEGYEADIWDYEDDDWENEEQEDWDAEIE